MSFLPSVLSSGIKNQFIRYFTEADILRHANTVNLVKKKLKENFPDAIDLVVEDNTPANDLENGTYVRVEMKSSKFNGLSPIKCHRMINDIFQPELTENTIHALSCKLSKINNLSK